MELEEAKRLVLNIFVLVIIATAVFHVYGFYNPLDFPGLQEKLLWASAMLGLLSAILYLPYERLLTLAERLDAGIRRIAGKRPKGPGLGLKLSLHIPSQREKFRKENAKKAMNWLFQLLLIVFLVLLLVQQFDEKLVSWIDMNYMLVTVIVFGALAVLFGPEKEPEHGKPGRRYYLFAVLAGVAGAGIIWLKVSDMGWLGAAMSVLSGILIATLSILIAQEPEPE